ncbi:MAG: hypothetical protein K9L17_08205 [Clostridiales bacterium]|nr:hypothetical protein [Clostridiales bacterium]MCF8022657.1 hypothetical protein [Clostridiales bacterium]
MSEYRNYKQKWVVEESPLVSNYSFREIINSFFYNTYNNVLDIIMDLNDKQKINKEQKDIIKDRLDEALNNEDIDNFFVFLEDKSRELNFDSKRRLYNVIRILESQRKNMFKDISDIEMLDNSVDWVEELPHRIKRSIKNLIKNQDDTIDDDILEIVLEKKINELICSGKIEQEAKISTISCNQNEEDEDYLIA